MLRRTVVFGMLGLALSACATGNALQAEKLNNLSPDDLAKNGTALVSLSGEANTNNVFAKSGRLRTPLHAMHITRIGTAEARYKATEVIGPDVKWIGGGEIGDGGVREIPAGKYGLSQVDFGDFRLQSLGNGPGFATVNIAAGEVLYLGHLLIVARKTGDPLVRPSNAFKVGIESREAGALEVLRQKFPQFADRMKVRLMTINPEVLLTEPPPAADLPLGAKLL